MLENFLDKKSEVTIYMHGEERRDERAHRNKCSKFKKKTYLGMMPHTYNPSI